jgi:hypothetical protein
MIIRWNNPLIIANNNTSKIVDPSLIHFKAKNFNSFNFQKGKKNFSQTSLGDVQDIENLLETTTISLKYEQLLRKFVGDDANEETVGYGMEETLKYKNFTWTKREDEDTSDALKHLETEFLKLNEAEILPGMFRLFDAHKEGLLKASVESKTVVYSGNTDLMILPSGIFKDEHPDQAEDKTAREFKAKERLLHIKVLAELKKPTVVCNSASNSQAFFEEIGYAYVSRFPVLTVLTDLRENFIFYVLYKKDDDSGMPPSKIVLFKCAEMENSDGSSKKIDGKSAMILILTWLKRICLPLTLANENTWESLENVRPFVNATKCLQRQTNKMEPIFSSPSENPVYQNDEESRGLRQDSPPFFYLPDTENVSRCNSINDIMQAYLVI